MITAFACLAAMVAVLSEQADLPSAQLSGGPETHTHCPGCHHPLAFQYPYKSANFMQSWCCCNARRPFCREPGNELEASVYSQ